MGEGPGGLSRGHGGGLRGWFSRWPSGGLTCWLRGV